MSRERTTIVSIAVATLLALALSPATAHAEKSQSDDSSGDVIRLSYATGSEETSPAPDNVETDVLKSVANHSAKRVKIKFKFADLLSGSGRASVGASIKTNKENYDLTLFRLKGFKRGLQLKDLEGNTIRCAGKKKDVDAVRDFIKISVPRSCLGSPRWIRVGIAAISESGADTFADDALRSGGIRKSGNLTFGPKLKRG